jgi:hypothetical protein
VGTVIITALQHTKESKMENESYVVIEVRDSTEGNGQDFYIREKATGEVRVLGDCVCCDMDIFDEGDWEFCDAVE